MLVRVEYKPLKRHDSIKHDLHKLTKRKRTPFYEAQTYTPPPFNEAHISATHGSSSLRQSPKHKSYSNVPSTQIYQVDICPYLPAQAVRNTSLGCNTKQHATLLTDLFSVHQPWATEHAPLWGTSAPASSKLLRSRNKQAITTRRQHWEKCVEIRRISTQHAVYFLRKETCTAVVGGFQEC